MPDRSQPPPIIAAKQLRLPNVQCIRLSNGAPVWVIALGTQDVFRLDVLFMAGRPWEKYRLAARATTALLREGTRRRSGAVIAEHLDFYGSSLRTPPHLDLAKLVLHAPSRYAEEVIPLVAELLAEPAFPGEELEAFKARHKQRLAVDLQKTEVVGYRQLTEMLYGADHPYGYNSDPEAYESLQRDWLLDHHRDWFHSGQALLVLSGKVGARELDLLERYMARAIPAAERRMPALPPVPEVAGIERRLSMPQPTVQSAVRIGRRLFNRHHTDFPGMYFLTTILGGYFGSRLMQSIREEKGYTYNIYSALDTFRFDGYFYIGTEVGHAQVGPTLREISRELRRLREDPVPEAELQMVRNYLMGTFLTMLDGPFQIAELVRGLVSDDLPLSFFEEFVERIRELDAEELQRLANTYLQESDLTRLVVGPPAG